MPDRVILGRKVEANPASPMGIWISRQGFDVNTADLTDMMLSSELQSLQILASGTAVLPNGSTGAAAPYVTCFTPDFGFVPLILLNVQAAGIPVSNANIVISPWVRYKGNTSFHIVGSFWGTGFYSFPLSVPWIAVNAPMDARR